MFSFFFRLCFWWRSIDIDESLNNRTFSLFCSSFSSNSFSFFFNWINTKTIFQYIHNHNKHRHACHGNDDDISKWFWNGFKDDNFLGNDFTMKTRITITKTFAFVTVWYGLTYAIIQTWLIIAIVNHVFTIRTMPTIVTCTIKCCVWCLITYTCNKQKQFIVLEECEGKKYVYHDSNMYAFYKVDDLIHSEYRWNQVGMNNGNHHQYCYMFHRFDKVEAYHMGCWRYYNWNRCVWNRYIFLEWRTMLMA